MKSLPTRLPNWHSNYVTFINEVRRNQFTWENFNCGVGWATRAVKELTGETIDIPVYKTAKGALRVIKRAGVNNLGDFVALYIPEIPEGPCQARIGDLALVPDDSEFGYSIGIVNGERIFVLRQEGGIGTVDLLEAKRAFRV